MLKVHMAKEFLISLVISFALHIASLFLMERVLLLGAAGILYSTLIFIGLLAVLCFVFTVKRLKYRQELIHSVLLPALAACIVGLIVMLLNKLLLPAVGNLPTLLITVVIGFVLYMLLLMVLRVLNEGELSVMPFGSVWIKIGRTIGLM